MQLAEWSAFHQQAGSLPEELGSVFDLIFYQGLSQAEAAEVLGISVKTIKRRWQKARLRAARCPGRPFTRCLKRAKARQELRRMSPEPQADLIEDLLARWEEMRRTGPDPLG